QPNVDAMAEQWLKEQKQVDLHTPVDSESPDCDDRLSGIARAYSLTAALFDAVTELVAHGELLATHPACEWEFVLSIQNLGYRGGKKIEPQRYRYPHVVKTSFNARMPTDPDIFLDDINCKSLHAGIVDAIEQS